MTPAHLLVPVATAAALMAAAGPIDDIDAYWHVVVGDEMRATGTVTGIGDGWAWYDPEQAWTTSQWMAEFGMSWLVATFGWSSLVWVTVALGAILACALLWSLSVNARPTVAVAVYVPTVLALGLFLQARPAVVTLIGATMVGGAAARVLRGEAPPRWWLVAPLVMLWANLHAGWVLAPAALGLATTLYWLGGPRTRRGELRRGLIVTATAAIAGCVNPLGVRSLLLPLEFSGSTDTIREWARTVMWNPTSLPLWVVLILAVVAVTRSPRPPHWTTVVYVCGWVVVGWTAFRNVPISAVMVAPVVAHTLSVVVPHGRAVGTRERRLLSAALVALTAGSLVWVTAATSRTDPLEQAVPLGIAEQLAHEYDDVRVLNDYNTSGVLVAFGPAGIELGIDGRAERHGDEYRRTYLNVFALAGDDWQEFLGDFDPEVAVVKQDQALRFYLEDIRGWQVAGQDGAYVLLEAPRAG